MTIEEHVDRLLADVEPLPPLPKHRKRSSPTATKRPAPAVGSGLAHYEAALERVLKGPHASLALYMLHFLNRQIEKDKLDAAEKRKKRGPDQC